MFCFNYNYLVNIKYSKISSTSMNFDSKDSINKRTKALCLIQQGEELFKDFKKGENKVKGYEIYKKGISIMIDYAKSNLIFIKNKLCTK